MGEAIKGRKTANLHRCAAKVSSICVDINNTGGQFGRLPAKYSYYMDTTDGI